jgi:glycine C-acetyltransferase/8-amino-7-oxononanoate synthase
MVNSMKETKPLQQVNRTYVRVRGQTLSYFGGCDYFRLASHPRILQAVTHGLQKYGLNVAASRVTTGNHELYPVLERELARFFRAESALLTTTGYLTNLIVAQSLARQFSHALVDERAHGSLQDAALMLNCPVLTFKHRDADSLATALQRCGRGTRPVVLTDGMFSYNGSIAPLRAYSKLLPRDGLLVVDDAHGAGTLGKTGRGSVELEQLPRDRVVQNITLSKAFGVYGGAILCSRKRRAKFAASRLFVGSTPLPLPLAFAAVQSAKLLCRHPQLRARLMANSDFVKSALRQFGFTLPDAPGPIVTLCFDDAKTIRQLKRDLLAADILPPLIHYPGGPPKGYFRFVISSEHTQRQLRALISALAAFAK